MAKIMQSAYLPVCVIFHVKHKKNTISHGHDGGHDRDHCW